MSKNHDQLIKTSKVLATKCFYCERKFTTGHWAKTIDHFVPTSKGGYNININKCVICYWCNHVKQDLLPEEFINKLTEMKTIGKFGMYRKSDVDLIIEKVNKLMGRKPSFNDRNHAGFYISE